MDAFHESLSAVEERVGKGASRLKITTFIKEKYGDADVNNSALNRAIKGAIKNNMHEVKLLRIWHF